MPAWTPNIFSFSLRSCVCYCTNSWNADELQQGKFLQWCQVQECPPGTYQNRRGEKRCRPCPAGYFNRFRGLQGIDLCEPCMKGTFNPRKGATSSAACRPCPTGKNSPLGSHDVFSVGGANTYPSAMNLALFRRSPGPSVCASTMSLSYLPKCSNVVHALQISSSRRMRRWNVTPVHKDR